MEKELVEKDKHPETFDWDERTTNWFYGHGGTLDAEGKAIFTPRHKEHPLPIEEIRTAVQDFKDRRFHPDRENDVLTRALGNKEKTGRTRALPGNPPWNIGFSAAPKKYCDRSRQRKKDYEKDEIQEIKDELKAHRQELMELRMNQASG